MRYHSVIRRFIKLCNPIIDLRRLDSWCKNPMSNLDEFEIIRLITLIFELLILILKRKMSLMQYDQIRFDIDHFDNN